MPINSHDFTQRLEIIDILYRFISFSFEKLTKTSKRDFLKSLRQYLSRSHSQSLQFFKNLVPDNFDVINAIKSFQKKERREKFRGRNITQYAEWVEDGLRCSELLAMVTIIEDFLKELHREALKARPALIAKGIPKGKSVQQDGQKPPQVSLEELMNKGWAKFVEERIEKLASTLGRQSMEVRLKYFEDVLDIPVGLRDELIKISECRNEIAHKNPLLPITKADFEHFKRTLVQVIPEVKHAAKKNYSKIFSK